MLLFAIGLLISAKLKGKAAEIVLRFPIYTGIIIAFSLGLIVWLRYDSLAPLAPRYVIIANIKRLITMLVIVGSLLGLLISSLAIAYGIPRIATKGPARISTLLSIIAAGYIALTNILPLAKLHSGSSYYPPKKILILGIDGGSWNTILPLIEDGSLPAMKELMEKGAYGYLDTYGSQFTPPVWTSIATGKVTEKHGIYHFGNLSSDWKATPIWSILSASGMRVAVVNWVCTWPPFEVDGCMITKVLSHEPHRVHLSEDLEHFGPLISKIIDRDSKVVTPLNDEERLRYARIESSMLRQIDREIISKVDSRLVAYY